MEAGCARCTPGDVVRESTPSRGDSVEVKGEVGGVVGARGEAPPQCPACAGKRAADQEVTYKRRSDVEILGN